MQKKEPSSPRRVTSKAWVIARAKITSQGSRVSSLKREAFSDAGSEANRSMRPQKKRRGDQAPLDYKGMTWCIYLWGQKPKIITDALVLGESLKASGTRAR